jgi:hypothetical protein
VAEDRRRLVVQILELWRSRGWTEAAGAARIVADGLGEGKTARQTASITPLDFIAQNGIGRAELAEALESIDLPSSSPESLMTLTTILFASAGPHDQVELRLAAEYRDVESAIRASSRRDNVSLISATALRPGDIIDAMNRTSPTILHISGHGDAAGVVMEDDDGRSVHIPTDHVVRLVETAGPKLRLVVFNCCESSAQAQPAVDHVDIAIGMTDAIGDDAARAFSKQLYSSLAEGVSVKRAFEQAKLRINLEGMSEEKIPALFAKVGLDSDRVVLIGQ